MKKFLKFIPAIAFLCAAVLMTSCGGDDGDGGNGNNAAEERFTIMSANAWDISDVSFTNGSNVDQIDFTALTLTFSGTAEAGAIATAGLSETGSEEAQAEAARVWPASSTFTFDNEEATSFTRNDNITVAITSATAEQLVLVISDFPAATTARVNSVEGANLTFTLVPASAE